MPKQNQWQAMDFLRSADGLSCLFVHLKPLSSLRLCLTFEAWPSALLHIVRSATTVYRLMEKGKLGFYQIGSRRIVGESHIEQYLSLAERKADVKQSIESATILYYQRLVRFVINSFRMV